MHPKCFFVGGLIIAHCWLAEAREQTEQTQAIIEDGNDGGGLHRCAESCRQIDVSVEGCIAEDIVEVISDVGSIGQGDDLSVRVSRLGAGTAIGVAFGCVENHATNVGREAVKTGLGGRCGFRCGVIGTGLIDLVKGGSHIVDTIGKGHVESGVGDGVGSGRWVGGGKWLGEDGLVQVKGPLICWCRQIVNNFKEGRAVVRFLDGLETNEPKELEDVGETGADFLNIVGGRSRFINGVSLGSQRGGILNNSLFGRKTKGEGILGTSIHQSSGEEGWNRLKPGVWTEGLGWSRCWCECRFLQGLDLVDVGASGEVGPRGCWHLVGHLVNNATVESHRGSSMVGAHQSPKVSGTAQERSTTIMMKVMKEKDLVVGGGGEEGDVGVGTGIGETLGGRWTVEEVFELVKESMLGRSVQEGRFPRGDGSWCHGECGFKSGN